MLATSLNSIRAISERSISCEQNGETNKALRLAYSAVEYALWCLGDRLESYRPGAHDVMELYYGCMNEVSGQIEKSDISLVRELYESAEYDYDGMPGEGYYVNNILDVVRRLRVCVNRKRVECWLC